MATIEISSSDFRGKMGAMFDRADQGEQIVIRRGSKRSYTLVPIHEDDDDEELSVEQIAFIDRGIQNIRDGKTIRYTTMEDFRAKMGL
jgi:antitoxin (DNA-binding transcriptional repressor) of toxin-antitoxin stability system